MGRGKVRGWRDGAQRKNESWTTCVVICGGGGIRGLNDNGKSTIKIFKKENLAFIKSLLN